MCSFRRRWFKEVLHAEVYNQDKNSFDPLVRNSSFMEQENAKLNRMKRAAVNMRQDHVLWIIRFVLYRIAVTKHEHWLKRDAHRRMAQPSIVLHGQTPPATCPEVVHDVLG